MQRLEPRQLLAGTTPEHRFIRHPDIIPKDGYNGAMLRTMSRGGAAVNNADQLQVTGSQVSVTIRSGSEDRLGLQTDAGQHLLILNKLGQGSLGILQEVDHLPSTGSLVPVTIRQGFEDVFGRKTNTCQYHIIPNKPNQGSLGRRLEADRRPSVTTQDSWVG